MSTIKVQDMSFSYAGSERLILKDINMEVKAGEFVCILGQSGCGKSTFLRLLAGLEKPTEGKLLIDEKEIKGARLWIVSVDEIGRKYYACIETTFPSER